MGIRSFPACLVLAVALVVTAPSADAQNVPAAQVLDAERAHFAKTCGQIRFDEASLTAIDYNNDKLTDIITNPGGVICDGIAAPECSVLGCATRFYTQLKDGSYHLTAEFDLYDWSMRLRYGNMVFVMVMQGGMCNRAAVETCRVEYRVRGLRFVELKRE